MTTVTFIPVGYGDNLEFGGGIPVAPKIKPDLVKLQQRCPRCGSTLVTNGIEAWCTFVGGRSERGCDFHATIQMKPITDPLTEALAEYAHDAWSNWMRYLFLKSQENEDESVTIPADLVARWKRQMVTHYEILPESEKESDRIEARKMMEIISNSRNAEAKAKID